MIPLAPALHCLPTGRFQVSIVRSEGTAWSLLTSTAGCVRFATIRGITNVAGYD